MGKSEKAGIRKSVFLWTSYQTLLISLLFLLWPVLVRKLGKGLKQRFGFLDQSIRRIEDENIILAHGASVGEVVAMANLIRALEKEFPNFKFVISTLTTTGQAMGRKVIPGASAFIYFPFDFSWVARRLLDTIRPRLFIITETELWPNFIMETKKRGIPVVLANGRISSRSFGKYRVARFFMKEVMRNIDLFIMQSKIDAERIISLGADASRVTVAGNLKFDMGSHIPSLADLDFEINRTIFVAGSTHRGEEEIILDVYLEIIKSHPDMVLVLAPRHLERLVEVEKLLSNRNLKSIRRTEFSSKFELNKSSQVILLDTIGELNRFYALARIVFVGGSLVPVGGHNILEPASLGKAVLFGPHMDNFREIANSFISKGGGRVVSNRVELLKNILGLLSNDKELERMGKTAREIVEAHKGASEKSARLIKKLLLVA